MQRRAVEAREGSCKGKVAAADVIEVTVAVHTGPGSNAGGADLLGEIMNMVGGRVGASLGEDALELEVGLPAGAAVRDQERGGDPAAPHLPVGEVHARAQRAP